MSFPIRQNVRFNFGTFPITRNFLLFLFFHHFFRSLNPIFCDCVIHHFGIKHNFNFYYFYILLDIYFKVTNLSNMTHKRLHSSFSKNTWIKKVKTKNKQYIFIHFLLSDSIKKFKKDYFTDFKGTGFSLIIPTKSFFTFFNDRADQVFFNWILLITAWSHTYWQIWSNSYR